MNALISLIAAAVTGTLRDWLATRGKIAEVQAEAKARAVSQGIPGWNDDLIVLVIFGIIALCFFPPAQPFIKQGFAFLQNDVPDWFVGMAGTVTGCVFGFDKLLKLQGK